MAKHPPLTDDEIESAKGFCKWEARHRKGYLATDSQGCRFTHKNLIDLCDLYLKALRIWSIDARDLSGLVRRYRTQKSVDTRAKKKRKLLREQKRAERLAAKVARKADREAKRAAKEAERAIKRFAREAILAKKREERARQGVLGL